MSNIEILFQRAQLAEAAYGRFLSDSGSLLSGADDVKAALRDTSNGMSFSSIQAEEFVSSWRVVDQYTAPASVFGFGGTGFSATLFQNTQSNAFTFAMRGTEPGFADLVADVNDLVVDGIAMDQLVDMFNYWQRLTTGAENSYSAARLIVSDFETAQLRALQLAIPLVGPAGYNAYVESLINSGAILDSSLGLATGVRRVERISSSVLFSGTVLAKGGGKLSAADPLDVVGHSLGGHLASAFTRLFPLVPAQAITINGAGFPTGATLGLSGYALSNIQNLFSALNGGASFDPLKIYNIHGSGPNFVTMNNQYGLVQPGSTQEVFIESTFPAPNHTFGHGVAQVTDSLALYNVFAMLDSYLRTAGLSVVNESLKPIFEAVSTNPLGSLERTVNALVKVFRLDFPVLSNSDDREGLFNRIVALKASVSSLISTNPTISVDVLTGKDASTIVASAMAKVGYRYALKELNPFALLGADSIYEAHNTGATAGALDLVDSHTPNGSLSSNWIEDRAKLLVASIAGNTQDNPEIARIPGSGDTGTEYTYYASDGSHTFFADPVDRPAGSQLRTQVVQFADDQGRELIGSDFLLGDRLYGGMGDDVLLGKRGDDILEGGRGRDYLGGDEGNDTFYSVDNTPGDRLRGGSGFDTYHVDFGDSVGDTPEATGSGRIYVGPDKVLLTGGTRHQGESFFKSADSRFVYSTDGLGAIYIREVGRAGDALKIEAPTSAVPGLTDEGSTVTTGRPDLGIALVTQFDGRPRPPEVSATPSIAELFKKAGTWRPRKDPLALDLGAPGLHTLEDLGEGIVRFDHDGNGSRTGTGWLTGEDAWVVLDRDGNSDITIGAELFGVDTQLPNGTLAHNGYEAIAPLDTNGDHKVDATDTPLEDWQIRTDVDGNGIIGNEEFRAAQFSDLQLWRDINHNGFSEPNELSSMSVAGIASIGTVMTPGGADLPGGNRLIGTSSFTRTDGSTGMSGALDLARETFYRDFTAPPAYDPAVDGLPSAKGSGRVRNLQEAAASSSGLLAALQTAAGATTRDAQWASMDELLRQWADSSTMLGATQAARQRPDHAFMVYTFEDIPSTSLLTAYNAATGGTAIEASSLPDDWYLRQQSQVYKDQVSRIEVLERFIGQNFVDVLNAPPSFVTLAHLPPTPTSPARNISVATVGKFLLSTPRNYLNESYEILKETVYGPIAAQTRLKPYIDAALEASDTRNFSAVEALLLNRRLENRAEGLADLVELGRYVGVELIERGWTELPRMIETWSREALADPALSSLVQSLRIGIRSSTFVYGSIYGDIVLGSDWLPTGYTPAEMELRGLEGSDYLLGGSSYEVIYAGAGNDIISLGTGGKRVIGGGGRDLYFFGRASGTVLSDMYIWDPVVSESDLDILQLLPGILPNDVRVQRETTSNQFEAAALAITIAGSQAKFIDKYFAANDLSSSRTLDALRFADGTTWDFLTLRLKTLEGSASGDILRGYSDSDDTIDGLAGNDLLRGMQGDDVLFGGVGNDTLEGARGTDFLDGGPGDDQLYGGLGVDTFLLRADGGHDTLHRGNSGFIREDYGVSFPDLDIISVASGIDPSHLRLLNTTGGLLIRIGVDGASMLDTGNPLNADYFSDGPGISRIEFANGAFWDAGEIRRRSLQGATENGETIKGYANSADVISGLGGNDVLYGFDGADELAGGDGNDTVNGDAGDDRLFGNTGDDFLYGGAGKDTLVGGIGNDALIGGDGDDIYLFARGDGRDTITETASVSDTADVLRFAAGIDPSEVLLARDANSIYLDIQGTGDGLTLSRSNLGLDRVEFADGTAWNHAVLTANSAIWRGSVLADALVGSGGIDHLQGIAGNDTLSGMGGDDVLEGGFDNDWLIGAEGDDLLDGGAGADRLEGGAGGDLYRFSIGFGRDLIIETGDDDEDVIRFEPGLLTEDIELTRNENLIFLEVRDAPDFVSFARAGLGIDRIEFFDGTVWTRDDLLAEDIPYRVTDGNDVILGTGSEDQLFGLAGNDFVDGLDGGDALDGGAGNDSLIGGEGDDTLVGGKGNDSLDGGPGDDTYVVNAHDGNDRISDVDDTEGNFDVLAFGAGIDSENVLFAALGSDVSLTLRATGQTITLVDWLATPDARIEAIAFDDGTVWDAPTIDSLLSDSLNIVGTDESDDLVGGDAGEILSGLAGDDILSGEDGDDILDGGSGDDFLSGGTGDDLLIGGPGDDNLQGGPGDDRYYFQPGFGVDYLNDFESNAGGASSIRFVGGIGHGDVRVHAIESLAMVSIEIVGEGDRLFIPGWRFGEGTTVGQIAFDDGTVWNAEEIESRFEPALPTEFDDILEAGSEGALLDGLAGDDWIIGGSGHDVLRGASGVDFLDDRRGSNLFDGGADDDSILVVGVPYSEEGGPGIVFGAQGNDFIDIESPGSIVAFNAGDGGDSLYSEEMLPVILSLGGGIRIEDLSLSQDEYELVLSMGDEDSIRFSSDLEFSAAQSPDVILQFIDEGNVTRYDFSPLIRHFYEALEADAEFSMAVGDLLPDFLIDTSTTHALGGDIAFRYAMTGSYESLNLQAMQLILGAPGFATEPQALTPLVINRAPTLDSPVADLTATEEIAFSFELPANTFLDADHLDSLTYSATQRDGAPLPAWLRFDGNLMKFEGIPANGDVGSLEVVVTAIDQYGESVSDSFVLSIENVNDPPVLALSPGDQQATEDIQFSLAIPEQTFVDEDAFDSIMLSVASGEGGELPRWLTYDANTQTLFGRPSNSDVGVVSVRITATDLAGADSSATLLISVANTNDAPGVVVPIGSQNAVEGVSWRFTVPEGVFVDPDLGGALVYSVALVTGEQLPPWLEFNPVSRQFQGVPGNEDIGSLTIRVTATDLSNVSAFADFNVSIGNVNHPPGIIQLSNAHVAENQSGALVGLLSSIDPDAGDSVRYEILPGGDAELFAVVGNRLLVGDIALNFEEAGSRYLAIRAIDAGGLYRDRQIEINVVDGNDPPVAVGHLQNQVVLEDSHFSFSMPPDAFVDPDAEDSLHVAAVRGDGTPLPSWITFDPITRAFAGIASNSEVGRLELRLSAIDHAGSTAASSFHLDVLNVNDAPQVFQPIPDQNAIEDSPFEFQVPVDAFIDVDTGDALGYTVTLENGDALPGWLHFDAADASLHGRPGNSDVGTLNLRVTASDSRQAHVSSQFGLTVMNTNDAPVAGQISVEVVEGETTGNLSQLAVSAAIDEDVNDTLTVADIDDSSTRGAVNFDSTTQYLSYAADDRFDYLPHGGIASDQFVFTLVDSFGAPATAVANIHIVGANDAPSIETPIADLIVAEDTRFELNIPVDMFSDVDAGDGLSISVKQANGILLPEWLTYDAATRKLTGVPGNAEVGIWALSIVATDGTGASVTDDFNVVVTNVNDAPIWIGAIGIQVVAEGQAFNLALAAGEFSDIDAGDTLTLSAANSNGAPLPEWLHFDPDTGIFSGIPGFDDAGEMSIALRGFDGAGDSAAGEFLLSVANVNRRPDSLSVSSTVVAENAAGAYVGTLSASDPDLGDGLAFSIVGGDDSGLFALSGNELHVGALGLDFESASSRNIVVRTKDDGGLYRDTALVVTVLNVNEAPTVGLAIESQSSIEDSPFHYSIPPDAFLDADSGDELSYSATLIDSSALPSWLSFDAATATFGGTPENADVGVLTLRVTASDTGGLSAVRQFNLAIVNVNDGPTLQAPLANHEGRVGDPFQFRVPPGSFLDIDLNDRLTYSALLTDGAPLPGWINFDKEELRFSGLPPVTSAGGYDIEIKAVDGDGAIAVGEFNLTIAPALVVAPVEPETPPASTPASGAGDTGGTSDGGSTGTPTETPASVSGPTASSVIGGPLFDEASFAQAPIGNAPENAPSPLSTPSAISTIATESTRDPTDSRSGRANLGDWYSQGSSSEAQQLQLDARADDSIVGGDNAANSPEPMMSSSTGVSPDADAPSSSQANVPSLWAMSEALLEMHLASAVNGELGIGEELSVMTTMAIGGGLDSAQISIGMPGIGQGAQSMQSFNGLQEGLAKLI